MSPLHSLLLTLAPSAVSEVPASTPPQEAANLSGYEREDEPALGAELAREPSWSLRPNAWARHAFGADVEGAPGDLSVSRLGASMVASRPWGESRSLSLGLSHERVSYDFAGGEPIFGAGNPLERPSRSSVWTTWAQRESEDFGWSATFFTSAGLEAGAELSDSWTWGGGASVDYQLTDNFAVQLGVYGTSRLEDSFFVYPVSAIDWQVSEDVHVGSEGNGVGVGIDLGNDVYTYTNIAFGVRQFRLDEDGFGPSQTFPGGVFRDDELSANLALVWTPRERLRVEFYGGLALRQLTLLDVEGAGFQLELDPAPFVGAALSFGL